MPDSDNKIDTVADQAFAEKASKSARKNERKKQKADDAALAEKLPLEDDADNELAVVVDTESYVATSTVSSVSKGALKSKKNSKAPHVDAGSKASVTGGTHESMVNHL